MSRFIFCSEPYHGHVSPVLLLVQELVQRGADVFFYTAEPFRDAVEASGASFRPIPDVQRKTTSSFTVPVVRKSHEILQAIVDTARADQPDCLVYDAMSLWAMLLAKILATPAARIYSIFPSNDAFHPLDTYSPLDPVKEQYPEFDQDMHRLCDLYRLPAISYHDAVFQAEPLNLVRFLPDFFPARDLFDERFHFPGPFLNPPPPPSPQPSVDPSPEPSLYISLGTVNTNVPPFYDLCLSAFGHQEQHVVISTGSQLDLSLFGSIPDNISMSPRVPQTQVLQQASAFITHGGMNSIMEALYFAVPMVVVPLTLEQTLNARRVEELHLGRVVRDRELTAHKLRTAVTHVQNDPAIQASLAHLRHVSQQTQGISQAADLLLQSSS
ncbi:MAG TPA: macrolide family glycosyltransferase [Ktedonobacteraceae bacterium]|nr:macrolide family glycosyltransferase [Ktedonobacteraceae bacterium]